MCIMTFYFMEQPDGSGRLVDSQGFDQFDGQSFKTREHARLFLSVRGVIGEVQ